MRTIYANNHIFALQQSHVHYDMRKFSFLTELTQYRVVYRIRLCQFSASQGSAVTFQVRRTKSQPLTPDLLRNCSKYY